LLSVPDEVFEDEGIRLALHPLINIRGVTVRDQLSCCEQVLLQSFGLWKAVGESAEASIDYEKLKQTKLPRNTQSK
jgi:hypothetical protein